MPYHVAPESIRPSLLEPVSDIPFSTASVEVYAPPLQIDLDLPANIAGTLLHHCFELHGHLTDVNRLRQITEHARLDDQFLAIQSHVELFNRHLITTFGLATLRHEVAVLAKDDSGSVINGLIDLLVETAEEFWIIDHKSDTTDDRQSQFHHHLPQLRLYQQVLEKVRQDKPVAGVGINWIRYGEITVLPGSCDGLVNSLKRHILS